VARYGRSASAGPEVRAQPRPTPPPAAKVADRRQSEPVSRACPCPWPWPWPRAHPLTPRILSVKDYTPEQAAAVKRVLKLESYYELLDVPRDASDADIKKAYKRVRAGTRAQRQTPARVRMRMAH
jgi:hypothetical protein